VETANQLADRLRALDSVERVVTLTDFVPKDQAEKLDIIEEVALFLGPVSEPTGEQPEPSVEERIEALRHLHDELGKVEQGDLPPEFASAASALRARLAQFLASVESSPSAAASLDMLEQSLLGSLPEQLRVLTAALSAGRVTLQNLPDTLIEQMVGEEGQVRIQTFPKADVSDQRALAEFVDEVRVIDPAAAGSASEIVGAGRAVVSSLQQALLSALIAVALVVYLIWRRVTDTALVLVPLGLATIFTVAAAVLLGTSTARAVAYSALTTIASFGTMGLASHRGLATLGQLLTLGVAFTLICNLVVLPALIVLRSERADARDAARSRA
jgi:predicted RND superfamily exporter protein